MQKAQQELSEYDNLIDNTDQKLYMINETIEPLK